MTKPMNEWAAVALLGSTYSDTRFWKEKLADEIPELAEAREFSTFSPGSIEGLRIWRAYVTPNAYRGEHNNRMIAIIMRNLAVLRAKGADQFPIFLEDK